MIADEELIRARGKGGRLRQITELAIGHPQPRPPDMLPHLGKQRRHQLGVVGLAVGMRGHGHR
jgi:hypothetical protein